MQIKPKTIERYWTTTLAAIEKLGGEGQELRIEEPATQGAISEVENRLGQKLPDTFKNVLLNFSRCAYFQWQLPDNFRLPGEFREIFAGDIHWSLERLVEVEESRRIWVRECFPDPDDPYDQTWHNKLAFQKVGNSDHLAVDLSEENLGAIVYLSHDDGEGHGLRMASSFESLVRNWSLIGGVGSEDWQWLPFYDHQALAIDPKGSAAQRFRDIIGVEFTEAL